MNWMADELKRRGPVVNRSRAKEKGGELKGRGEERECRGTKREGSCR